MPHPAQRYPVAYPNTDDSFIYFDLGKGSDYLYHGQNRFIGVHTHDELLVTERQADALVQRFPWEIFPEYYLIRVNEFNQVAKTPLEEWVRYLKSGVIAPDTTVPGLQEAREKLRYYDMSPAERHAYDEHINAIMIQNDVIGNTKLEGLLEGRIEGHAEGLAEGLAQGRTEGQTEERRKNARGMKAKGIDTQTIAEITGLNTEEIDSL